MYFLRLVSQCVRDVTIGYSDIMAGMTYVKSHLVDGIRVKV